MVPSWLSSGACRARSQDKLLDLEQELAGSATIPGSISPCAPNWVVSAIGRGVREELRGSGAQVTLIEPGMVDTPFLISLPSRR